MTSLDTLKESTLAWVNGVRAEYREEPLDEMPAGVQVQAAACSLALALPGTAVVMGGDVKINGGPWVKLPIQVREFYQKFDAGCYPELLAEGGTPA